MLMPKKVKYRKQQRGGKLRQRAKKGAELSFGSFGLRSLEAGLVSARQIEASRRAMTRYVQRGGKIWIRVFPSKPMTKKGDETPMGKGKGAVDHFVAVAPETARRALKLASAKLCVKTRIEEKI
ncbi:MAG: 50S ribosomal protein L16 [Candidatus Moranbacteria bacterium GW2011_GWF1_44_4]|nr:MAG: 50S ribosomal protein L16 [Candidatus Moranbacteria bacterium GW2011_GWF1_44_4]